MQWFLLAVRQYAVFQGRSRRREYWYFGLFGTLFYLPLLICDLSLHTMFEGTGFGILSGIYTLALLVPSIAVGARRMHDINQSGWLQILNFIPVIGAFAMLYFTLKDGDVGSNQFGPDPKGREAEPGKSPEELRATTK
jgi:uncharacterized membrane protein YhaH (DUF805 family)